MLRVVRFALCVAVLCAGVAVSASSATAAVSECPSSRACVWKDVGYVTEGCGACHFSFENYSRRFSTHNYAGTTDEVHDDVSSVANQGNFSSVHFNTGAGYGGAWWPWIAPGDSVLNLPDDYDNKFDSGCFSPFCP
jgi:Peptidase inhibitor family I36